MNKKIVIAGIVTLVLLLGGVAMYFLLGTDTPENDEYSSFGFTNEAVGRPEGTAGEVSYEDDELIEYGTGIAEVEYQEDLGGGSSLYDRSIAGQFPQIESPVPPVSSEASSGNLPVPIRSTSPSSGAVNKSPGAGTPTTPSTPKSYTLTVTSPTAGSVLSNRTCPADDDTCIERPITTVFWTYGDLSARITIELWSKTGLARTLATKTPNSGRYTWGSSPTLPDGNYKLVLYAYSSSGTLRASYETGYFEVSKVKEVSGGGPGTIPPNVEKVLSFEGASQRFKVDATGGKTVSFGFDFVGYEMGKVTIAETGDSIAGDTSSYTAWISKTPGGTPIGPTLPWQYTGGAITFASGKNPYNALVLSPGKYYFNATAKVSTNYWVQLNLTKDVAGISAGTPAETFADYDISGKGIPLPTGLAGASMCEGLGGTPTPGSGTGPCGSYQIPLGSCSSGMTGAHAITKAWQYNLEDALFLRKGNSIRFSLPRNNAMVFRFKTGSAGESTLPLPLQFAYDEHTANGPTAVPFITLSEKKCDFDYDKLMTSSLTASGAVVPDPVTPSMNNCYQGQAFSGAILGQVTATQSETIAGNVTKNVPKCQLKPNTVYYLNIRYEQAVNNPRSAEPSRGTISCSASSCGMVLVPN